MTYLKFTTLIRCLLWFSFSSSLILIHFVPLATGKAEIDETAVVNNQTTQTPNKSLEAILANEPVDITSSSENETSTEYETETSVEDSSTGLLSGLDEDEHEGVVHHDPRVPVGAAFAAARLDVNLDDVIPSENETMHAEVFFIQRHPDSETTNITVYIDNIEPDSIFMLTLAEWGDLTTEEGCGGSGAGSSTSQSSTDTLQHFFTSDENGTIQQNFTTKLAPLWGSNSIVGRMVILYGHYNTTEELLANRTSFYLPEKVDSHGEFNLYEEILGCSVVGIANDFSVYQPPSLGIKTELNWWLLLVVLMNFFCLFFQ